MWRWVVWVALWPPSVVVGSVGLLGVHPEHSGHYSGITAEGPFKCIDGSIEVRGSQVNDNYCDCPDGSDEPATPACSAMGRGGTFWCLNAAHRGVQIPTSRVWDGICDCCDGSDEPIGTCRDTCLRRAAAEQAAKEERRARVEAGRAARDAAVAAGLKAYTERAARLEALPEKIAVQQKETEVKEGTLSGEEVKEVERKKVLAIEAAGKVAAELKAGIVGQEGAAGKLFIKVATSTDNAVGHAVEVLTAAGVGGLDQTQVIATATGLRELLAADAPAAPEEASHDSLLRAMEEDEMDDGSYDDYPSEIGGDGPGMEDASWMKQGCDAAVVTEASWLHTETSGQTEEDCKRLCEERADCNTINHHKEKGECALWRANNPVDPALSEEGYTGWCTWTYDKDFASEGPSGFTSWGCDGGGIEGEELASRPGVSSHEACQQECVDHKACNGVNYHKTTQDCVLVSLPDAWDPTHLTTSEDICSSTYIGHLGADATPPAATGGQDQEAPPPSTQEGTEGSDGGQAPPSEGVEDKVPEPSDAEKEAERLQKEMKAEEMRRDLTAMLQLGSVAEDTLLRSIADLAVRISRTGMLTDYFSEIGVPTEKLQTELNAATSLPESEELRVAREAAEDSRSDQTILEDEKRKLEEEGKEDFGPQHEYYTLKGRCFDLNWGGYDYNFCPFDKVTQEGWRSLGTWSGWHAQSEWHSKYRMMKYNSGDWSGCPEARKTEVHIECGTEEKVVKVDEVQICQYSVSFTTPAACTEE